MVKKIYRNPNLLFYGSYRGFVDLFRGFVFLMKAEVRPYSGAERLSVKTPGSCTQLHEERDCIMFPLTVKLNDHIIYHNFCQHYLLLSNKVCCNCFSHVGLSFFNSREAIAQAIIGLLFVFNSRTAIAGAVIGLLLVFLEFKEFGYNSKNLITIQRI